VRQHATVTFGGADSIIQADGVSTVVAIAILPTDMATNPLGADAISAVGRSMGFSVQPDAAEALGRFGRLFLQWNDRINLASLRAPSDLPERHFVDAFAASRVIRTGDVVADVGAGGGLPAIPLALLQPTCRFELFEPIRKKVAFLRTAVRELGLSARVVVHPFSVTNPPAVEFARRFDVASSRATFAPPAWLQLGGQLVRPGGRILVFAAGESAGGLPPAVETLDYGENRRLLVFESA